MFPVIGLSGFDAVTPAEVVTVVLLTVVKTFDVTAIVVMVVMLQLLLTLTLLLLELCWLSLMLSPPLLQLLSASLFTSSLVDLLSKTTDNGGSKKG